MKKIISLILAIMLCAALAAPAYAGKYYVTIPCEFDLADNDFAHIYFTPEESGCFTFRATAENENAQFNLNLCNNTTNPRGYQAQVGGKGVVTYDAYLPAGHNFELVIPIYSYDDQAFHISIFRKVEEHTHQKDPNAYHAAVDPTCIDGSVEYWNCTTENCDVKLDADGNVIEDITVPATGEHSFETSCVTPASCMTPGEKTGVCTVCGETVTVEIPAIGKHGELIYNVKPATCGKSGEEIAVCSVCHQTVSTRELPATGEHSVSNYTLTTPATCTTPGVESGRCSVCGKTVTRETALDPNAHSFGDYTVTKAATCTTNGEETATCACGKTVTRETALDPNAHSFSTKWSYDKDGHWHASTCGHGAKDGYGDHEWKTTVILLWKTTKCSVCGVSKDSVTASTLSEGNVWIVVVIAAAAVIAVGAIVVVKKKRVKS